MPRERNSIYKVDYLRGKTETSCKIGVDLDAICFF